jgi:ribosome-binding factor A
MAAYSRMDRINDLLQEEIARLLQREIKDPRIGFVSVIKVKTNKDLKSARVYISVYGEEEVQEQALQGLASAAGYIRSQLFRALSLKTVPKLTFVLDESIAYSARISSLLQELDQQEEISPQDSYEEEEPEEL